MTEITGVSVNLENVKVNANIDVDANDLADKMTNKLGNAFTKTIGMFAPKLLMQGEQALAASQLLQAQTKRDIQAIEKGDKAFFNNELVEVKQATQQELIDVTESQVVQNSIEFQETRRLNNIRDVAAIAMEEIPDSVNDEEIDLDWMTKFLTYSQDISNEELQKYWGKLLRGEAANPNQFSVRTLDVLKNISTNEAQLFERLIPFIWDDYLVNEGQDYLDRMGLPYVLLMALADAGLIYMTSTSMSYPVTPTGVTLINTSIYEKGIVVSGLSSPLILYTYNLTKAGRELKKLVDTPRNDDYIRHVMNKKGYTYFLAEPMVTKDGNGNLVARPPEGTEII